MGTQIPRLNHSAIVPCDSFGQKSFIMLNLPFFYDAIRLDRNVILKEIVKKKMEAKLKLIKKETDQLNKITTEKLKQQRKNTI